MADHAIHRPLTRRDEIRMLEVSPASQHSPSPLQCTFRHISLQDDKKCDYETISYYWGDQTLSSFIMVDDQVLSVPANTEKALRRMAFADATRVLWIDAVCINQSDLTERSEQVQLMGRVFSSSAGNLIYFGDEHEYTACAMSTLQEMHKDIVEICTKLSNVDRLFGQRGWQHCQGPMQTDINVEALKAFYNNAWFRRLWPVQELVLARKSLLHQGQHIINFRVVIDVAAWMLSYYKSYTNSMHVADGLYNAAWMRWFYQAHRQSRAPQIQHITVGNQELEVCDGRDRIYGMLGMAHPNGIVPDLLAPDYAKSLAAVFRDACLYVIKQEGSAIPLKLLRHRSADDLTDYEYPSWVYRVHGARDELHDPLHELPPFRYQVSSPLSGSPLDRIVDRNILPLDRRQLDTIHSLSGFLTKRRELFLVEISKFVISHDLLAEQTCGLRRIARTLVANGQYAQADNGVQVQADFEAFLGPMLPDGRSEEAVTLNAFTVTMQQAADRFTNISMNFCVNRQIMLTSQGHIGICPKICIPGDIVVLLSMAPLTVVPRPVDDHYFMIGECYLDGAFDNDGNPGELELDHLEEKVFEIH